jgi:hypothetical protein
VIGSWRTVRERSSCPCQKKRDPRSKQRGSSNSSKVNSARKSKVLICFHNECDFSLPGGNHQVDSRQFKIVTWCSAKSCYKLWNYLQWWCGWRTSPVRQKAYSGHHDDEKSVFEHRTSYKGKNSSSGEYFYNLVTCIFTFSFLDYMYMNKTINFLVPHFVTTLN